MDYSYITDPGKVREHNEDSVIIVKNHNNEYLLAVADGMGGHRGGEIASSIAISHIGKCFKELGKLGTKEEAIIWIKNVVSETNVLIYKYTEENPESAGMGTTLVLSVLTEDYLLFGNIGDSSGYVYSIFGFGFSSKLGASIIGTIPSSLFSLRNLLISSSICAISIV